MVTLTIDNKKISVPEGTTIMKAAASVGIMIPHLCYLEGINEISACKVCVVEMQGKTKLITACNNPVEEGMVLYTNSPKVRAVRTVSYTHLDVYKRQIFLLCRGWKFFG